MIPLRQSKTGGIAVRLFLYIPVVWAALLIAQSPGGGLPDIIGKLTAALETPFKVHWTEYSALSILFCTAAYILALLYAQAFQALHYSADQIPHGKTFLKNFCGRAGAGSF